MPGNEKHRTSLFRHFVESTIELFAAFCTAFIYLIIFLWFLWAFLLSYTDNALFTS